MKTKRQALLNAALSLFIKRGFHDTPTSLIAKQAKVATGTLFYHFEDKEALINEIYLTIIRELSEALQKNLENQETLEGKIRQMWFNEVYWGLDHAKEIRFVQLFANSPFVSGLTKKDAHNHLDFALDLFAQAIEKSLITNMTKEYARDFYISNALMNINYFLRYSEQLSKTRLDKAFQIFWQGLTKA